MSVPDPISNSNLPPEVQELVRQVVGRARLWKGERESLTLELLAHFGDGLEAGRSAEDLIKTFGDPRLAAKLMRRGKKRNRPLWWRAGRRVVQGVGILAVLYLGQMGILLSGRPEPKIDYAARLCQKAETIAEADRAWPIYREAWRKEPPSSIARPFSQNRKSLVFMMPGDPEWEQAVAFLQRHSVLLEAARAGGMKRGLGITLGQRRGRDRNEYRSVSLPGQPVAVAEGMDDLPMNLGCPENQAILDLAKLLWLDIRLAGSQKDAGRIIQDYRSIVGLCKQMCETPSLMGQLCSRLAIRGGDAALADVITVYPDLFTPPQYGELLQAMPDARGTVGVSVEGQRAEIENLIQWIYSDDGKGGGRLTLEGAELVLRHAGWATERRPVAGALALPLLSACVMSRPEMVKMTEEHFYRLEKELHRPLGQVLATPSAMPVYPAILPSLGVAAGDCNPYPSMGKEMHITHARHDGLTVALAIEAYRRTTGGYPRTLDELVPQYLASIPRDPLANRPLLYRLHEGKPVIYACGQDGKDRGGIASPRGEAEVPVAADWILFPSVVGR